MTLRQFAPFAAVLGVLAVALVGWRVVGRDDPAPQRTAKHAPMSERRPRAKVRPRARAEAAAPVAPVAPALVPKAAPRPIDELPALLQSLEPGERQELRDLVREERFADTVARLDGYAETAGWNEALTAEVRVILEDTHDGVSERLLEVDAGALTRDQLEAELRDFRLVQANRLRDTLGDPGFLAFAEGMEFWSPPPGARPPR